MEPIYNQRDIPKEQWRYGLRSSAATGCGWVATYNALVLMGYRVDIPRLIALYERQVPLIHGNAGTLFCAPKFMLEKMGFSVVTAAHVREFDRVLGENPVCILYYFWRDGLRVGSHFVAVQQKDGVVLGYNTYRNSAGPDLYGSSLAEFVKNRKWFGCVLYGIRQKKT